MALVKGEMKLITLLCEAGFPLPEFSTILKRLPERRLDGEIMKLVDDFFYNPRTIVNNCRVYIRKWLRNRLLEVFDALLSVRALPPKCVDLILAKDLLT